MGRSPYEDGCRATGGAGGSHPAGIHAAACRQLEDASPVAQSGS